MVQRVTKGGGAAVVEREGGEGEQGWYRGR